MRKGHEEREHAPLPPSASGRWMKCSPSMAYVRALIEAKLIKKRVSGQAAQRGTRIHELAEPILRARLTGKKDPTPKKGTNAEELSEALHYVEACVALFQSYRKEDPRAVWGIEDRASISEMCWGSRDFWCGTKRKLAIVDLKSGREPVHPATSTQHHIYAGDLVFRRKPSIVELYVWQPNSDEGGEPMKKAWFTVEVYQEALERIEGAAAKAERYFGKSYRSMEKDLRAGDHCQWCDALGVCPAAKNKATEISSANFLPVPVEKMAPPPVKMLTPEQVAQVLERAPLFAKWLDEVRVHALELMQKGKKVPGFKAVAKQTRFAWEGKYTHAQIAKLLGLKLADLYDEPKLLSPAKVKAKLPKEKKAKVDGLTWRPFDIAITKESDRRTAIESTKISFQPVSLEEDDDG